VEGAEQTTSRCALNLSKSKKNERAVRVASARFLIFQVAFHIFKYHSYQSRTFTIGDATSVPSNA
jgi:hypothetical protein